MTSNPGPAAAGPGSPSPPPSEGRLSLAKCHVRPDHLGQGRLARAAERCMEIAAGVHAMHLVRVRAFALPEDDVTLVDAGFAGSLGRIDRGLSGTSGARRCAPRHRHPRPPGPRRHRRRAGDARRRGLHAPGRLRAPAGGRPRRRPAPEPRATLRVDRPPADARSTRSRTVTSCRSSAACGSSTRPATRPAASASTRPATGSSSPATPSSDAADASSSPAASTATTTPPRRRACADGRPRRGDDRLRPLPPLTEGANEALAALARRAGH